MDHPDLAWKLLLRHRLPAVLARLAPGLHAAIDWTQEYFLPDKSLPPLAPDSRTGEREPDFAAIVTLLDGRQVCLHVEIQCTRQAGFEERMALYHSRLRDRFATPVISLALLGDRSLGWRPDSNTDLRDGCGTIFRFQTVKLLDFRQQLAALKNMHDPVSIALTAHLIALATRRSPERRRAAKLAMLLSLYPRRGTLVELSELQKIIDWMLPLPSECQRRMSMDIEAFLEEHEKEDKNSINYLIAEYYIKRGRASGEAKGLEEGKAVGLAKGEAVGLAKGELIGQRRTIKLLLGVRFGKLPPKLLGVIDRANPAQLERLSIALLDAATPDDALNAAGLSV